ncbi:MAG: deoxyribodipyrimidine photolyase [Rhodobacterales bacterium]|nr:MAG: deoxyribodipyrimidine photolyase [Rhodobacterales bacterium]
MTRSILLWLRRDLRLSDHPALSAACATGAPVIPVYVDDGRGGAAPRLRLGLSLHALAKDLAARGSRLILRRGDPAQVLHDLASETGAQAVYWSRLYDADGQRTGRAVKETLGIEATSFAGHLLFEPWSVETGQGGPYKVYTPFWKAVRSRDPGAPLPAPGAIPAPEAWPSSDRLEDWAMGAAMKRGAEIVAARAVVGEEAARGRLDGFCADAIRRYQAQRDVPTAGATSNLSENLTTGEISPRTVWAAGWRAVEEGKPGAETFIKELVWREFAHHLAYHFPTLSSDNWRGEWNGFPWSTKITPAVLAWMQGRTGVPFVDAGMREMHVTGRMHNRVRMVAASYLTKHLLTDWRIGLRFFEEHLTDWDPASNAMGWQWVAGSGPDAAPFFRIFNPDTQAEKFDPDHTYRRRWIAEGQSTPGQDARAFFDVVPRRWGLTPTQRYPDPVVDHKKARARALAAYESFRG